MAWRTGPTNIRSRCFFNFFFLFGLFCCSISALFGVCLQFCSVTVLFRDSLLFSVCLEFCSVTVLFGVSLRFGVCLWFAVCLQFCSVTVLFGVSLRLRGCCWFGVCLLFGVCIAFGPVIVCSNLIPWAKNVLFVSLQWCHLLQWKHVEQMFYWKATEYHQIIMNWTLHLTVPKGIHINCCIIHLDCLLIKSLFSSFFVSCITYAYVSPVASLEQVSAALQEQEVHGLSVWTHGSSNSFRMVLASCGMCWGHLQVQKQ